MSTYEIISLIFSALTFAAAVIVAIIYGRMLVEMRKSTDAATKSADAANKAANLAEENVKLTHDNARLDQRAWVYVQAVRGSPESAKPFLVTVTIVNTGRTFAKNIDIVNVGHSFTPEQTPDYAGEIRKAAKDSRRVEGRMPLAPNHPVERSLTTGTALSDSQIQSFKNGDAYFLLWGQITYDDVFDDKHWLTFCGVLRHYSDQRGWTWEYYKDNNDSGDGEPPWKY